jgi:glycosyltransferase involved in cell wall biosynthesis
VLYVGKANHDYYRLHGVPEKRLFFSPHAIDNDRFLLTDELAAAGRAWRAELGIPEGNLLVLFAGKFEQKKRPLDLLRSFSGLKQPNAALLFAGAGILEPALREAAKGMEWVFFAPFQNQSLMPRTYAAADLFVLPSYGNQETWGLAINEALCAAKPVVVSNHVGSGPDLVVPGTNGLIFEAGNVESLAVALKEALSDQERLIRWGRAGQRIVSNYNFAHATKGLERALVHAVTSNVNHKE